MAGEVAPRLFIVEFDLADRSSHFFNQVLGFKLAAEQRGMTPCVLLPKGVDPSLADPLNAHAVIEFEPPAAGSLDYELDAFAEGDKQLRSLWAAIEDRTVSRDDIVLITSARPVVIYSLGAWLGRLDRASRPAIFIRFYNHDYLDLATMRYSDRSWMHRLASRDLALRPGQERVFFTANNETLITPLGHLCARRIFYMPIPKHFGDASDLSGADADARRPVVYVHVNARTGAVRDHIERVVRIVLSKHPDVRFLLKDVSGGPAMADMLSANLIGDVVVLIPPDQSHADHLRIMARSHVVLLPYEPVEYQALASGVFAEGAALGKVLVCPDGTWMARQLAEGRAAGISFAAPHAADISAALLKALASLPRLLRDARARSSAFRDEHSCGTNLDMMLKLAGEPQDMQLTYALGSTIHFNSDIDARGYLGRGWGSGRPHGFWTEGPLAELFIRCEHRPDSPINVRIFLTPFLSAGHPQAVAISVNGVSLARWDFPDDEERRPRWRELTIPANLAASDEIAMRLHVDHPLSPKQVGLSEDPRALGVLMHEMILTPEKDPGDVS
jgi:hypothetical protein